MICTQVEIGHTLPAPGTEKKQLRAAVHESNCHAIDAIDAVPARWRGEHLTGRFVHRRAAFKAADGDKDGYLTPAELRQAMDGMAGHGPLADSEFEIMLQECMRDGEIEEGEPIAIDKAVRFFLTQ